MNNAVKVKGRRSGQSFIHGAMILTIGMAIVKVVGALFKVPLKSVIGEYGMGLFNIAYNFYGPIHSLAAAGLPIAISKMVSECYSMGRYNEIRKIKSVSAPIFLCLGAAGTGLMLLGAPYYCREIIKNQSAVMPMLVLAPAVLFGCLGSIYRGYFEGLKNMYPTAVSEVIEAVSKLMLGLTASIAVTLKLEEEYSISGTIFGQIMSSPDKAALATLSFAAAAAILGITLGSLFSFLFLFIRFQKYGDEITSEMLKASPKARSGRTIAKRLIQTAVPIAIGSVTVNIAGLIDTTFLQKRLAQVMENDPQTLLSMFQGNIPDMYLRHMETIPGFLFGCYSMALTVYMIVPTITQAFSISALPSIARLSVKNDRKKLGEGIEKVIRITALFSFPAGIGITATAPYISSLLYGDDMATPIVGSILTLLGTAAAFAAISTPLSSMLQAVGRSDIPVKLLLAAMGIKVGVNYVLCSIPSINVYGAAIGTLVCYLFLVIGQTIMLCKVTGVKISVKDAFLKPLLSALICGGSAYAAARLSEQAIPLSGRGLSAAVAFISVAAGFVIYVLSLWATGTLSRSDLYLLPKGQKIMKILEKRSGI